MTFASVAKDWSKATVPEFPSLLPNFRATSVGALAVLDAVRSVGEYSVSDADVVPAIPSIVERLPIERELYAAKQRAKIYTLNISNRIAEKWRDNLFWQLDAILEPDDWDDGDLVLDVQSWASMMKAFFVLRPTSLPGLGLSESGAIVASWSNDAEHLDIEFGPNDTARWLLVAKMEEEVERASGRTNVLRLAEVLAPYKPERWLGPAK